MWKIMSGKSDRPNPNGDLKYFFSLEIRKADHGVSLPDAPVAYPNKPLSYTQATSANVGDHMELALVDGLTSDDGGMFDLYA